MTCMEEKGKTHRVLVGKRNRLGKAWSRLTWFSKGTGSCEHDNKALDFINTGNFLTSPHEVSSLSSRTLLPVVR